ncbi:WD40/YVTN repeat-like-containing domain protein [Ascosphaera apis ARSEF 7405]|uniref:WD40/YVTN repeat-like-containing domain protein n=1 Tax=Ascosphaera apis ARSEF 7405 TaxID=392613 RepID=A0A167VCF4_9EURO|nr:WD40/YVTN repeat-like-containing domain protein [Ascosphaera apis ARSEF 7405]
MQLTNQSQVPVYTISGSNTARPLPDWLARRRKRSLKNDPEYANRVELLQDFEFEEASQCIRVSEDGQWVMSTGTYKPQMHVHYLPHLSLSYARHTVSLNTTFLLLSSDYSKSLHLQADRSLEFHTPSGCHYTTRLPRYGRDLVYDRRSAEALVPAVGVNQDGMGEVFRLNLEQGQYMRSYEVDVGGDDYTSMGGGALQGGINTGAVNTGAIAEESHNLLAFGTSIGTVELWDSRARGRAAILAPPSDFNINDGKAEITALKFHRNGLTMATGSSQGLIYLYDLRSPVPILKKDQGYGYPIHTLDFLTSTIETRAQAAEPKILSADKRIIKIWDARDGTPWTSVEPAVDLNCVAWCKDSGMLLTANEGQQQHSFFIPQLGPAPKWCSFLDNIVEEMAEDPNDPHSFNTNNAGSVYDNFKFLTRPQLAALSLDHLIGKTSLLRPYMHGFFVAQKLYEEARLIANPYAWEEERAKRVKEKIEKERESRIRGKKKVQAKVNKKLAEKIAEREERMERRRARNLLKKGDEEKEGAAPAEGAAAETTEEAKEKPSLLNDPRFSKLFVDEDFAVDESSYEFRALNSSTQVAKQPELRNKDRGLTAAEEELVDEVPKSSDEDESSDEDDGQQRYKKPAEKASGRISSSTYKSTAARRAPRIDVATTTHSATTARDRSFGSRIQKEKPKERVARGGSAVGSWRELV